LHNDRFATFHNPAKRFFGFTDPFQRIAVIIRVWVCGEGLYSIGFPKAQHDPGLTFCQMALGGE
jgi:hypothetical protein